MTRFLLGLALALAMTQTAAAQQLWAKANLGDSQAAVAAAVPGAKPPAEPDSLGGAELRLEAPNQKFNGQTYLGRYFFKDGKLASVQLQRDRPTGQSAANLRAAAAQLAELNWQYQGPGNCKPKTEDIINILNCNWNSPSIGIGFTYLDVNGEGAIEVIVFRAKD